MYQMIIFRKFDQRMSDKWPAYELSSAAKSTTSKSRYVHLHIFLMSSIKILQNYVWYFEHNQSILGLLLDSTREQTIQTQLQLNSTVTTRESAAVLPSEEKYSNHGAEKPIAISDGCPAPRAQVISIYILSKLDINEKCRD